jgi:hypothetical protein
MTQGQINTGQQESPMPPRPVDFDPTMPLRNEKHERFARLRAILTPKLEAAREAGFATMTAGNVAKLDRRRDIRARISALSQIDEEIIQMKRERIETRLNLAAYGNLLQFATIDQETGEITAIDWRKVAESDLAVIISDFSFDPKTGRLTKFERDSALNAINQLRELYGFKSPAVQKTEHSFNGVGLGDRLDAALARMAIDDQKALSTDIEKTAENGGVESK